MNRNQSNQMANPTLKTQTDKIQRKQMANRVGSYFPKGGHSATQTELNV